MNRVMLIGRLTADIELKRSQSGYDSHSDEYRDLPF